MAEMVATGRNRTGNSDVYIGLDLGTTVLKAAAFERRSGRRLAGVSQHLAINAADDGRREQSPAAVVRAMWRVMAGLRRTLGRRWCDVAGLGLAAQGGSAAIVDPDSGAARTPLFLWNDMRCMGHLPQVQKRRPRRYWRELAWRDEPGWGLAKLLWLRTTRPASLRGSFLYAGAGDLLFHELTGCWRQDAGNALQVGCYRVAANRLDASPLRLVGFGLDRVSPLRSGHETQGLSKLAARRLGLAPCLPVAGPYMDHEAGYMAVAGVSGRPVQFSLGTAWVGNFVMPPTASWASPFQLVLPSPTCEGKLVVQPLLTGNVTWDWALRTLVDQDPARAYRRAESIFREALLPPRGLLALPWLNMPNPLLPGEVGGGTLFGLSALTTRAEMLRAVAASMVHEARRVFGQVVAAGAVDSVVLSGGASRAAAMQRLFAAAFAPLPVHILSEWNWLGCRGVLWPLGVPPLVSASRVRPDRAAARQIVRAVAGYEGLLNRLCGHVTAGGPVCVQTTGKGNRP